MVYTSNNSSPAREKAAPPIRNLRDGLLNIAIWERQGDNGNFYNITFERRYLNKDGDWKGTGSLGEDDLLVMAELLRQAYNEIKHLRLPIGDEDAA